jgi:lambda family phage tail tape measure protein
MADLKYTVGIDSTEANNALNSLKAAVTGLFTALAVKELAAFSDGLTNINNKLRSLTPDAEKVNTQFNALVGIALASRQPLSAVSDLFYKIQRSQDALGISTRQAADITEVLAKQLSMSGMSSREAAGPLLQFGQALQSGVFQGDELRSILEGLGPVAKAIADELGVPVGSLKRLGSEGQISADIVVKAMLRIKDQTNAAFATMTPTISGAFENLKTAAASAFNNFEQNSKTGQNLALSIEYIGFQLYKLSKNIDDIIGPLSTLFKIIATLAAFTVVGRALTLFGEAVLFAWRAVTGMGASVWMAWEAAKDFGAVVMMAGSKLQNFGAAVIMVVKPLGALLTTIASIGAAIYTWSGLEKVTEWFTSMTDKGSENRKELEAYREEVAKMNNTLDDTPGKGENAAEALRQLGFAAAKARLEMTTKTENLDLQLKQTHERLAIETEIMRTLEGQTMISKDEAEILRLQVGIDIERRNAIKAIKDEMAKLNLEYSQLDVKDSKKGKELKQQVGILGEQLKATEAIYDQHVSGMSRETRSQQTLKVIEEDRARTLQNITHEIDEQVKRQEKLGEIQRSAADQLKDLDFSKSLIGTGGASKQIAEIQQKAKQGALEAGRAYTAAFENTGDGLTPEKAKEIADGLDQITLAYQKIAQSQIDNLSESRKFSNGWKEAFESFADNATNAANQARQIFDAVTSNMSSAIDKFVDTGKFSFADFTNSVIRDLIKIQLKAQVTQLFSSMGVGNLFGLLPGKAIGGPVDANSPYIVGEQGPELFMPKTAGTILPNNRMGGGTGAGGSVVYNINAVDAMSFKQMIARDPQFLYAVTQQGAKGVPQTRR